MLIGGALGQSIRIRGGGWVIVANSMSVTPLLLSLLLLSLLRKAARRTRRNRPRARRRPTNPAPQS